MENRKIQLGGNFGDDCFWGRLAAGGWHGFLEFSSAFQGSTTLIRLGQVKVNSLILILRFNQLNSVSLIESILYHLFLAGF